jgi:excisionase family DNA binding protein
MDSLAFGHYLVVPIALSAMPGIRRRSVMTERRLTIDGINDQYGVNPDTIYKWITRKRMPAHKPGRLWKFLASGVDQWVKNGSAGASKEKGA